MARTYGLEISAVTRAANGKVEAAILFSHVSDLRGDRIVGEERLLDGRGQRIRDVRVGKDGGVYVLTDAENGKLLKLEPPAR